ncbi:MAG: Xaa-Pro peptidase family protein [Armatimonadota bacterium]|nr:Xaa-Pro peptidase family protein [Armatimonadota bacterium]
MSAAAEAGHIILPGASRVARLKAAMRDLGVEALLAASPANVRYMTGFALDMQSLGLFAGGHPLLGVLLQDADSPVLIAPITDASPLVFRGALTRFRPYGRNFMMVSQADGELDAEAAEVAELLRTTVPARDAVQAAADILKDSGVRRAGVDDMGLPAALYAQLAAALPEVDLVPASGLFRAVRAVKEPGEIQVLRTAAAIVEEAMAAVWATAQPGVSEAALAHRAIEVMTAAGARPTLWYVGAGSASALVDRLPTDRRLRLNDLLMVDFGCEYHGYYADLARTAVLGRPDRRLAAYYAAIQAGEAAGIGAIRPGRTGAEVFEAAVRAVRATGIPHFDRRHCGHGIGLEPYDAPAIAAETAEPLQAGMVVNIETPYYELGWGGLQLEDTVLVAEHGVEFLSTASRDLLVL